MDNFRDVFCLTAVTDAELQTLGELLWGWTRCACSTTDQPCPSSECLQRKLHRLQPFFQYYKLLTNSYIPESLFPGDPRALNSHSDLLEIIKLLKEKPDVLRIDLTTEYFSRRDQQPPLIDQHRAFNMAMGVILMMSCCIESQLGGRLEFGTQPATWRSDMSPVQFISSAFPLRRFSNLSDIDKVNFGLTELTAANLKRVAGLKFQGTSDLSQHLKLDARTGTVSIYHYTSVLREHLRASRTVEPRCGIPRQLALETFESIRLLFPRDSDSHSLLRSLVSKRGVEGGGTGLSTAAAAAAAEGSSGGGFDPDCLCLGAVPFRRDDDEEEADVKFRYWAPRLVGLLEEIENPKPRGLVDRWLEQRSKARHVMLATLAGVVMAILLGILGLIVGIFQAWVSYEAWRHPVGNRI